MDNTKYRRIKVDDRGFYLIVNGEIYKPDLYPQAKLPKFEFKKGKTTYAITDLRYLNEKAVELFKDMLAVVCNKPNCESLTYYVKNAEEDELQRILDIVTSINVEYKRRGVWGQTSFLTMGYTSSETADGKKTITFDLVKENAKAIYNYVKNSEQGEINFYDLVVIVAKRCENELSNSFGKDEDNE